MTSLLMQIDDLPSYAVVIAATNHSELLDRAVWRRFQLRIHLPAPTEEDLAEVLRALSFIEGESAQAFLGRQSLGDLARSATRKPKSSLSTRGAATL